MRNDFTLTLFCALFAFTIRIATGQIKSQMIKPELAPQHGVMFERVTNLTSFELPSINVKDLLKEDSVERTRGKPFRFGKAVDVNIDFLKMASKLKNGDSTLFFYKITSKSAFSINLIFNDFFLANNASLLIYNSDRSMIYGPIISQNNPTNRIFWTDLIKGESIIIQLTLIGKDTRETSIRISKIIHGYQNTFAGFGESASCNRDIACEEGDIWRDEGNSVAMLLLANGQRFCSGVILNNACQDFTPNLLTAFHCLDVNQNGELTEAERNEVNNWVFRFLYESPNCGGGDGTIFQSINGSNFRSAFQPSDFALLLLNTRPIGNVMYAGWSRTNVAATSGAAIHHPNGDVKKISIDNDALTNVAVTTTWAEDIFGNPTVQCPPDTHWQAIFDSPAVGIAASTVQPGSSGSPIFDQNQRVVGQLHGDFLNEDNNFCANRRGHYGRFDVSWGGGGTPETQLNVWLTNDPNVIEVNTLGIPNVVSTNLVCNNETFTLQNQPPNSTITWTSSNPNGLSVNSTSGAATRQNEFNGQVTITASILSPGPCNPAIFTRTVWVGTPSFIGTSYFSGTQSTLSTWNSFGGTGAGFVRLDHIGEYFYHGWNLYSGTVASWSDQVNPPWASRLDFDIGPNQPYGTQFAFNLASSNNCGTLNEIYHFYYTGSSEFSIATFPNPASSTLNIQITSPGDKTLDDIGIREVQLIDVMGTVSFKERYEKGLTNVTIIVDQLRPDIYTLRIFDGYAWSSQRVIIEH